MKTAICILLSILIPAAAACPALAEQYPSKPIQIVVPFAAAGGTDLLARIIQKALEKKLPQPMAVVNMPGAAGIVGARDVKNARPDGYKLLLSHATVLTAAATGACDFGPEAFEPIAGTATDNMVVCVAKNSPYNTLKDLLEAAKAKPGQIRVVTNIGAIVHFAWLKLADVAGGVEFRYIQSGGAGPRLIQIVGKHAEAGIFATSEAKQYHESGDLKILAVLGNERQGDLPDIPTAKELGYNTQTAYEWWWFAPKGTPQDRVNHIAGLLKDAMSDPDVQKLLKQQSDENTYLAGDALKEKIATEYEYIKKLAKQFGLNEKK